MAENNQKTMTKERAERWVEIYKDEYKGDDQFWRNIVAICTGEKTETDIMEELVAKEILEKETEKIDPIEFYKHMNEIYKLKKEISKLNNQVEMAKSKK